MIKGEIKCLTRYCRANAIEYSDYCRDCRSTFKTDDADREPVADKVYDWTQACLFCKYRDDRIRTTEKMAGLLIKSGRLRCPECRSPGVTFTRLDYGSLGSPLLAREGAHPWRAVAWKVAH